MRLLFRFLTLSRDERRFLLRAGFLLATVRLAQGHIAFETLRRLVVRYRPPERNADRGERIVVDRVVWAVTAWSRRTGRWTTCLTQALTVQALLARHGCSSRLHVGVSRDGRGALEAHAWVEREGRVLIGGSTADVVRFTPLTVFEVDATKAQDLDAIQYRAGALREGR